jgi:xanthine dehydrogenase molybdenum-binding subunit
MAAIELKKAESAVPLPFGTGYKLIGHNYPTNDQMAKVLGTSKFAEDFRAEGMLFCRLLLCPMPHARVKRIRAEKALAMPGVRGIITADDIPAPADYMNDMGTLIKVDKRGERALTNEPMYVGDPILAVAAVDELTAANAIELIEVDLEPLPFAIDPLETLRPGGPNPREDGNVWSRPAGPHPGPAEIIELKWTEQDFAEYKEGRLPMGHVPDEWSYGDLDAGFKNAALVLDETFVTSDTNHECLEPRTSMAYWQNGKLYLHTGTQGVFQTVPAIARAMQMDEDKVVFISEYTGGGFGSKSTGAPTMIIPAVLSKKLNAPVMMRISRAEEHYIGRARPSVEGRIKIGFTKDGRITALDMFTVCNSGAYGAQADGASAAGIVSLLYQPPAMRSRAATVMTNTVPRSAQCSPGGMQGITLIEPILAKAARQLGVDQVALRRVNCPEGKAEYGPVQHGKRAHATSCFLKQALDLGAERFKWKERVAQRPKRIGSKVRGIGVSLSTFHGGSTSFDGLVVITPEGRVQIHSGVGTLGTESVIDVHRATAEKLDVPWEACDIIWGDTSKGLPYTCVSGGSQTIHDMTRAGYAVGEECKLRLREIAAKTLGGSPDDYEVANQRVSRKGGGAGMSFAQAAQHAIRLGGIYDGHDVNPDVNKGTKKSVASLAGTGLVASAKDMYSHDGDSYSYLACFAEVEVDVETGKYYIVDYQAYADVGTVIHPAALGGQVLGRSTLGMGHAISQKWVYDPEYGAPVAMRFYQTGPPSILDVPVDMKWDALNIPDPETPVGARGCGEPPVGGGCCAILNALSDALGDEVFQRTPVNADTILTSLEAGRPMQHPLMANI